MAEAPDLLDTLLEVRAHIVEGALCTSSKEDPPVWRCFDCDGGGQTPWPEHDYPACPTKHILGVIDAALRGAT